jgi:hypothetical protein
MRNDFIIECDGLKLWLSVHDTRNEMHANALEYGVTDFTIETLGGFVPVIDSDKIGIIYLNMEHIKAHVVTHECGHAAIEIMRKSGYSKIAITESPAGQEEERFLHLQSDITKIVYEMIDSIR